MASVYKVAEIEGKGLGCVAILDIEKGYIFLLNDLFLYLPIDTVFQKWQGKFLQNHMFKDVLNNYMMKLFVFFSNDFSFQGSLILNESSQIRGIPMKTIGDSKSMKILLKSFYQMSKADQLEYLTLRNKFINIPDYKNYQKAIDECLEDLKLDVRKIEHDPEKAKEIFKIYCIFLSNMRSTNYSLANQSESGLMIKTSRFQHSCKPNAISMIKADDLGQIRAISNIKAGQEIHIEYNGENDPFFKFRNRQQRQKILFERWLFVCSCELCEDDVDIDASSYEKWIQDAEKLTINRNSAFKGQLILKCLFGVFNSSKNEQKQIDWRYYSSGFFPKRHFKIN